MKYFEEPELIVLTFSVEDVVTTSEIPDIGEWA